MEATKQCSKCREVKPLSEFSKDTTKRDGHSSRCKRCAVAGALAWRQRNLQARMAYEKQYYDTHRAAKKAYAAQYRQTNLEAKRASEQRWREANRDKCRAYYRLHRERLLACMQAYGKQRYAKCREVLLAKAKQYYRANAARLREKSRLWRAANTEHNRAYQEAYRKRNCAVATAARQRRRARKLSAPGYGYTTAQHLTWRWEMFGGCCWMCGKPADAFDHVIPLAAGGPHWPANLRPICTSCNSSRPKARREAIQQALSVSRCVATIPINQLR